MALTEAQFTVANDKIDDMIRATKRGTPERDAAQAVSDEWEAANEMPCVTVDQRKARHAALAAVAAKHGLV